MRRRFKRTYRGRPPNGGARHEMSWPASAPAPGVSAVVPRAAPGQGTANRRALAALKQRIEGLERQAKELRGRVEKLKPTPAAREPKPAVKRHAVVDRLKCTGCRLCEEVCPVGAIRVTYIAKVDAERCTACGACVENCPQGALRLS